MTTRSKRNSPNWRLAFFGVIFLGCGLIGATSAQAGQHRVGLGVHYWQTVDDLVAGAGLEEDGISFLFAYQYQPKRGWIRYELDLEYFADGFGGSDEASFAPIGYVVVGDKFYVAGGLGVTFSSGLEDDWAGPFYTGRIGYQFEVLPNLRLDLNANYRTNAFEELGNFDTETLSFGVIARFKL